MLRLSSILRSKTANQNQTDSQQKNSSSRSKEEDSNKSLIAALLRRIELLHNIRILYAVEAGPREFSLASNDSNYNIRFIYVRNDTSTYFSLDDLSLLSSANSSISTGDKAKYWNYKLPGSTVDWTGYDLDSALKQAYQMTPSLVELLYSANVYKADDKCAPGMIHELRALVESQRRVEPLMSNYRALAVTNFMNLAEKSSDNQKRQVVIKDYVSTLRYAVMLEWLMVNYCESTEACARRANEPLIETSMDRIVDELQTANIATSEGLDPRRDVYKMLRLLSIWKRASSEHLLIKRIECVDEYLVEMLANDSIDFASQIKCNSKENDVSLAELSEFFHSVLNKVEAYERQNASEWFLVLFF